MIEYRALEISLPVLKDPEQSTDGSFAPFIKDGSSIEGKRERKGSVFNGIKGCYIVGELGS